MRKIFAFVSLVFCLSSCEREVDIFLPNDPAPVSSAFQEFFQDLQPAAQIFQVSTDQDTTLNNAQGVRLFIPAGAFTTVNGDAVDGIVEVHLQQAFNKGKWVANRMSTITESEVFEYLGALRIQVMKNDVQLKVSPAVKLRFDVPREVTDGQPRLFRGINDQDNRLLWLDVNDQTALTQSQVFDLQSQQWQNTWQWETSSTGWFACGKYLAASVAPNPTFCITLPEGYDETNTAVFAIFQENNSVVELEWGTSASQFCTDLLPVGYKVTLLSISAKDQNHYLGFAETTLEEATLSIPLQPIGTTPAIFAALLDEL